MRQTVTVFGGTGFLGRRIVRHLHQHDFKVRIASRHPDRCENLFPDDDATSSVLADVNDDASVAAALGDSWAAVNAVSLYVERDKDTFQSVHVTASSDKHSGTR